MDRLEAENNRFSAEEWFGVISLESILSIVHVIRVTTAVYLILQGCLGTVIGLTLVGSSQNLR